MSVTAGKILQSMEPELYDWQEEHVDKITFALKKFNVALDASDMGTGKTIMALKAARRCGRIPVIVCPLAVVPVWKEWHRKFFPNREPVVFNYEKARRGVPSYLVRKGKNFGWTVNKDKAIIIFDEVHRCKGEKSLNSKLLGSAKRDKQTILMLSATAFSSPLDMRASGYALGLHGYRDHWVWCQRNGCKRGWFGGLEFNQSPTILRRLNDEIFGRGLKGSRIRISNLPEGAFPEGIVEANSYKTDAERVDWYYSEMNAELARLSEREENDGDSPLVVQLRARQEVELLKVPVFMDLAKDALATGNSIVLFVNFKATLEALNIRLAAHLGFQDEDEVFPISLVHGGQSSDERAEAVGKFQSNEHRICICMVQAGGVGLSLHDLKGTHPRVSFISPSFSAIDLRQSLGRVHRAGGLSLARQYVLFAADSVEEDVCRAVRRKLDNLELLNDGDLMSPIL